MSFCGHFPESAEHRLLQCDPARSRHCGSRNSFLTPGRCGKVFETGFSIVTCNPAAMRFSSFTRDTPCSKMASSLLARSVRGLPIESLWKPREASDSPRQHGLQCTRVNLERGIFMCLSTCSSTFQIVNLPTSPGTKKNRRRTGSGRCDSTHSLLQSLSMPMTIDEG